MGWMVYDINVDTRYAMKFNSWRKARNIGRFNAILLSAAPTRKKSPDKPAYTGTSKFLNTERKEWNEGEIQCCHPDPAKVCTRRYPWDSASDDDCFASGPQGTTLQRAFDTCRDLGSGWNLCSREQLNSGSSVCAQKGCGLNAKRVWAFESKVILTLGEKGENCLETCAHGCVDSHFSLWKGSNNP